MDPLIKLLKQIKEHGDFTVDGLAAILEKLKEQSQRRVDEKRKQIERILGEISQLTAMHSMLVRVLSEYVQEIRERAAMEGREKEMIRIKEKEAKERLKEQEEKRKIAAESEGIDLQGNIVPFDEKPNKIEEPKKEVILKEDKIEKEIKKPVEKKKKRNRR